MKPSPIRGPSAGATDAEGLRRLNDEVTQTWQLRLVALRKTLSRERQIVVTKGGKGGVRVPPPGLKIVRCSNLNFPGQIFVA